MTPRQRCGRRKRVTVLVKRSARAANTVPRWAGGRMPLSNELAAAIRSKLDEARRGIFDGPEMLALRPILDVQSRWSRIPAPGELLIERLTMRDGHHFLVYPFEGRLVHEGLAALVAYRLSLRRPQSFSLAANDYGSSIHHFAFNTTRGRASTAMFWPGICPPASICRARQ